jgi:hypothetical protein
MATELRNHVAGGEARGSLLGKQQQDNRYQRCDAKFVTLG